MKKKNNKMVWIEDGDLGSGWFPKKDCIKTKFGWTKKQKKGIVNK